MIATTNQQGIPVGVVVALALTGAEGKEGNLHGGVVTAHFGNWKTATRTGLRRVVICKMRQFPKVFHVGVVLNGINKILWTGFYNGRLGYDYLITIPATKHLPHAAFFVEGVADPLAQSLLRAKEPAQFLQNIDLDWKTVYEAMAALESLGATVLDRTTAGGKNVDRERYRAWNPPAPDPDQFPNLDAYDEEESELV